MTQAEALKSVEARIVLIKRFLQLNRRPDEGSPAEANAKRYKDRLIELEKFRRELDYAFFLAVDLKALYEQHELFDRQVL